MNNPFNNPKNPNNMMTQFEQFKNQIAAQGIDPRQKVQELLNSGQMSQDQFNRLSQMANAIMGRNRNG